MQGEKSTASREWGNENEEPHSPAQPRRECVGKAGGEIKGTSEFKCTTDSNSVCLAPAGRWQLHGVFHPTLDGEQLDAPRQSCPYKPIAIYTGARMYEPWM